MSEKFYKNVTLELRPRLQSVNVLVSLAKEVNLLNIVLNEDSFEIVTSDGNCKISCNSLKIVLDSLSSVNVSKTCILFRFATCQGLENWGSFKSEVLKLSQTHVKTGLKDIFLHKSDSYKIFCKNCSHSLSVCDLKFDRVLPLPSENSEPSDWFCHAHAHGSGDQVNFNLNLNPKEFDIFYTNTYFHVHRKIVDNILISDEKIIACKRCLSWLGLVKNPETVKFWFNTVIFKTGVIEHSSDSLRDCLDVIREVLSNVLFNTAKILLQCYSSKNQIDYILIWVMEKQLNIQIHGLSSDFRDCTVAKVLFKCENDCSDVVKSWESDSNVCTVSVSKPMAVEILKHLHRFNKVFPKEFSESNGFYISYLMYDQNLK